MFDHLPESGRIFGIVGLATGRSISPRVHQGAYRALGLECHHFVGFSIESEIELDQLLETPVLAGLTVVSPFKERALALADDVEPAARNCGAANLLVRTAGGWRAETTDAWGVLAPLQRRGIDLRGLRVTVVGCGGAGRAAAAGLRDAGATVRLANRHPARARYAAELLGLAWVELVDLDVSSCDLIINATPLGRDGEPPAFDARSLPRGAIVVDFVYAEQSTPLVRQARAAGHEVIDGREVLVVEVARQFERMTGHALSETVAHELAGWPAIHEHSACPNP